MEGLSLQWILAILAVYLLQVIKDNPKIPIFNNGAGKPNAILAAILAAFSATGIAYAHSFDAAAGTYTMTVTGLTASSIVGGLWGWAQQYGWQWIGWKLVKGKV